jgi:cyclopropane fatty-acyl-phospholipid synthase-like methyltransferase
MSAMKLSDNFYDKIKPRLYQRVGKELRLAYRVLDLGCGACELARYLSETYGQKVTGVDISAPIVFQITEISPKISGIFAVFVKMQLDLRLFEMKQ